MVAQKNWNAFYTIVRKEVHRFMRIWTQTLLPPVINQSLYFIVFGAFIGSQIADIQGISYMAFIVPGLVMMAVISNSFANVVSSFFGSKFQRNVEELTVSPTPNWVILAGYCAGGMLRGSLTGAIIFLVSAIFITPVVLHPVIIAVFILLTSLVFSLGGFINALYANSFDDIGIFPTFIMTPLTYFGGVFYSIKNLPEFWQSVSQWNPILYMVDGFRYGFYGVSDIDVTISISILVVLTILLTSIALYLLEKGTGLKN
jgi:ABC-2 type transport system permease protein